MKKSILSIIMIMAASIGFAQTKDGTMLQPTHVVGKRINAEGVVTKELVSDFSYLDDGKLSSYVFPEYYITASYDYTEDFLTQESISHEGGSHIFTETNIFTYENGQIKTISHLMSQMGTDVFWEYSYYDDGRLKRKDMREEDEDDFYDHWLYEYENEGRTVIETHYTSWVTQGVLVRSRSIRQYDDSFVLLSTNTENYNESGELTSSIQIGYEYTASGLLEVKATQALVEGEWLNTSITRYLYDESDRIMEQLDGSWDTENAEWNYTHRIVFENSDQDQTYTVSFYKKSNGEWVWDVFGYQQTILFGDELKAQQRALEYMVYEPMNGYGNVNQIVFTMEEMNRPVYLSAEEQSGSAISVYPNPSTGLITIKGNNLQRVDVINMLGQEVLSVQGKGNEMQIDLSRLPAGTYMLRVTMEDGKTYSDKVVKE